MKKINNAKVLKVAAKTILVGLALGLLGKVIDSPRSHLAF